MRQIKFRVWYSKIDRWCYFTIGQTLGGNELEVFNEICLSGSVWQQFTGLLDKNGKEIYEGDIVQAIYEWTSYEADGEGWEDKSCINKGVVIFESGEWRVKGEIMGLYKWDTKTLEVVGNIYENPDKVANYG